MVRLIKAGCYSLAESHSRVRILKIDTVYYGWKIYGDHSELFVVANKEHLLEIILSVGNYRLYEVKEESGFHDGIHLELFAGRRTWQGYLLPDGFPTPKSRAKELIPLKELVTRIYSR